MDISKKYNIPKKYISCPKCGRVYGHHNSKVCENCEECSTCCSCGNTQLVTAEKFIEENMP